MINPAGTGATFVGDQTASVIAELLRRGFQMQDFKITSQRNETTASMNEALEYARLMEVTPPMFRGDVQTHLGQLAARKRMPRKKIATK